MPMRLYHVDFRCQPGRITRLLGVDVAERRDYLNSADANVMLYLFSGCVTNEREET